MFLFPVPEAVVLRVKLVRLIWRLMVAIFVNYVVTLLVFPGLVSEVQYCRIGDWMPVILITVFNFTDFIAKVCCTPIRVLIAGCSIDNLLWESAVQLLCRMGFFLPATLHPVH